MKREDMSGISQEGKRKHRRRSAKRKQASEPRAQRQKDETGFERACPSVNLVLMSPNYTKEVPKNGTERINSNNRAYL